MGLKCIPQGLTLFLGLSEAQPSSQILGSFQSMSWRRFWLSTDFLCHHPGCQEGLAPQ